VAEAPAKAVKRGVWCPKCAKSRIFIEKKSQ
jgi:hypothetical protein